MGFKWSVLLLATGVSGSIQSKKCFFDFTGSYLCHPTRREVPMAYRVYPKIVDKIRVGIGGCHLPTRSAASSQTRHSLCSEQSPDVLDWAYYPELQDIRNHINKAKRSIQLSVALKVEQWKKNHLQQTMSFDHSTKAHILKRQNKAYYGFTKKCGNKIGIVTRLPW